MLTSAAQAMQLMPHAVKLKEPSMCEGQVDYETIKSWIYSINKYYALVGPTDEIQQARFVAMLLTKHAALCLWSSRISLDHTRWSTLKVAVRDYF